MGVPGLWDILRPAGEQRSLGHLAIADGFINNHSGRRGLRIGIDASIWFYHATRGREGENPELRTLFFRCARLMRRPFLPLFVFDGPKRPNVKRGKKVGEREHWMISGMQEIITAFGFEWHRAPGEAEAELAYLNRVGVIDAIVTDDVDTFVFGAKLVIRNNGKLLTGNNGHPVASNAASNDTEHTYVYDAARIASDKEIALSTDGLILIALLIGGDYDTTGLPGCGPNVAHALARCGFGESLMNAARKHSGNPLQLRAFLDSWRGEIRQELKTNARGYLNSKKASLASKLPNTFPDIEVLQLYAKPITSENYGSSSSAGRSLPVYRWDKEPNLALLGALCERKFEWGTREDIIKRFRKIIWDGIVQRILRRAVLDIDEERPSTPTRHRQPSRPTSPSKRMIARQFSSQPCRSTSDSDPDAMDQDKTDADQLIVAIKGKRAHASMDGLEEYRLVVSPRQLVRLTQEGIQGLRSGDAKQMSSASSSKFDDGDDEMFGLVEDDSDGEGDGKRKKGGPKKPPPHPDSVMRMWMPVCMVELVEPGLVASYEGEAQKKKAAKGEKEAKKASGETGSRRKAPPGSSSAKGVKGASLRRAATEDDEDEDEMEAEEDFSDVFDMKPKPKPREKSKAKQRTIFEENNSEDDDGERRNQVLSPSPSRPSSPSKLSSRSKFKAKTKDNLPPSGQGRIDDFMKAAKLGPPAAGSSTSSLATTSKKQSLLEALESQSSSSSLRAPSVAPSTASLVEPSTGSKSAPKPFPMPAVYTPLEMARQRNGISNASSSSTSMGKTASANSTVTMTREASSSSTALTSASSNSHQAIGTTNKLSTGAGNAKKKATRPLVVLDNDSDEDMPTTLSGITRTSHSTKSRLKAEAPKARESVIEISSDSDTDTPASRVTAQPSTDRPRTPVADDTIILTSSPLAASPRRPLAQTQTKLHAPSSPMRQARIDLTFKTSKMHAQAHVAVETGIGKPKAQNASKKCRRREFSEDEIIDIDCD